jgi:hypothetical protein
LETFFEKTPKLYLSEIKIFFPKKIENIFSKKIGKFFVKKNQEPKLNQKAIEPDQIETNSYKTK